MSSRVGIANSAVTDWRLYDTIYTERYMGLLGGQRRGLRLELGRSRTRRRSKGTCS